MERIEKVGTYPDLPKNVYMVGIRTESLAFEFSSFKFYFPTLIFLDEGTGTVVGYYGS